MHSIARHCFILVIALLLAHTVSVLPLAHALSPTADLSKNLDIGVGLPVTTQAGFEEGLLSDVVTSGSPGDVMLAANPNWYNGSNWWNSDWPFRKPLDITNSSGGALTDYQVKVIVNTQELIPAKMQSDGADIRFTQSDCTTEIPNYWIDPATINTASTEIWVKLPSIPTGTPPSGGTTIYLYYGNASATAVTSESNTFSSGNFTDSFADETNISSSTNVTVSGGEVSLSETVLSSTVVFSDDFASGTYAKWDENGGTAWGFGTKDPYGTSAYAYAFNNDGPLTSDSIDLTTPGLWWVEAQLEFDYWINDFATELSDLELWYYKEPQYQKIDLGSLSKGSWNHWSGSIDLDTYGVDDFRIRFVGGAGGVMATGERVWVDNVKVTVHEMGFNSSGSVTSVTVPEDTNTRFAVGTELSWNDTKPTNTDIRYQVYYLDGTWQLVPEGDLPGNAIGFDSSPIDISSVAADYGQLRVKANLSTSSTSVTPSLQDWTLTHYSRQYTDPEPSVGSPGTEESCIWVYRKPIDITNSSGSVLTDYQVKVIVNTQELIPAKMQSDGADIRFTQSDGQTEIPYWIESGINTTSTQIWVKVPSIPTGDSTIYLFYGNSGATAASSVSDTFSSGSFTDSFTDETKISSSTNVAVSGGEVTLYPYSDEFNDGTLDSKWTWDNEPGCWGRGGNWNEGTTTPGRLRMVTDTNTDTRGALNTGHYLYQEISGDFEIEIKLYGVPMQHWEQSGIAVMQDADNFLKCGYGGKVVWILLIPVFGRGMAVFREVDNIYTELVAAPNDSSPKYVRLRRTGNLWQSWFHNEGTAVWTALHSWTQAFTDPVKIGLAAADGANGAGRNYPTEFDYFRVNAPADVTSVTIPTDTGTRFAVGNQLSWNDDETPAGTDIKYQVYHLDGTWQLIPDADLPGNSTGFDTSPIDMSSVKTDYEQIRLVANLSTSDTSVTPRLQDWTITYYYRQYTSTEPTTGSPGAEESLYYNTSGTIASKVFDTGKAGTMWMSLSWAETLPASTDITFEVRASNNPFAIDTDDITLPWTSVGGTSPVDTGLPSGRYMQWRATLTTSGKDTSSLHEVRVLYS